MLPPRKAEKKRMITPMLQIFSAQNAESSLSACIIKKVRDAKMMVIRKRKKVSRINIGEHSKLKKYLVNI